MALVELWPVEFLFGINEESGLRSFEGVTLRPAVEVEVEEGSAESRTSTGRVMCANPTAALELAVRIFALGGMCRDMLHTENGVFSIQLK